MFLGLEPITIYFNCGYDSYSGPDSSKKVNDNITTRIMIYNSHLIPATLETLDFLEIF